MDNWELEAMVLVFYFHSNFLQAFSSFLPHLFHLLRYDWFSALLPTTWNYETCFLVFILTQLRIIIMPAQVTTKRPFLTRGWHKLPSVELPWKATVVIIQGSYYWLLCLHYQCTLRSLRLLCGLTNISKKALILSIDFI